MNSTSPESIYTQLNHHGLILQMSDLLSRYLGF
ncbi:hypothetical protein [Acinetobacter baumannii]